MSNRFDDEDAQFLVLVNAEEQHSLWPVALAVPPGWQQRFGPDTRPVCLAYVNEHWTDMRPKSLIERMNALN